MSTWATERGGLARRESAGAGARQDVNTDVFHAPEEISSASLGLFRSRYCLDSGVRFASSINDCHRSLCSAQERSRIASEPALCVCMCVCVCVCVLNYPLQTDSPACQWNLHPLSAPATSIPRSDSPADCGPNPQRGAAGEDSWGRLASGEGCAGCGWGGWGGWGGGTAFLMPSVSVAQAVTPPCTRSATRSAGPVEPAEETPLLL